MIGLLECNFNLFKECVDDVGIVVILQIGDQGLIFGCISVILVGLLVIVLGYVFDCMCVGVMIIVLMIGVVIGYGVYDIGIVGGVEYMGCYLMGFGVDVNLCFVVEKLVDFVVFVMGVIVENFYDCFFVLIKECVDYYGMCSQQKVVVVYVVGKIQFDLIFIVIKSEVGWGFVMYDEGMWLDMMMEGFVMLKILFCVYG